MGTLFFKLELNLHFAKPLRCIEPRCQCLEVGQQCFEWFWRRLEPLFVDLLYFGHGLNKNISTKHLAQPSESHVVLNGLCLLHGWSCNGRCNSEQMGWGLGEWVGVGGVLFCGSAGEPGSQSGRWRNHLPTTSRHPSHTPDTPTTCDNSYNKSAYEKNLMAPSLLFFKPATRLACHAGNRKYQTSLFTSEHVTQKVCTAEQENKMRCPRQQ